MGQYKQTIKKKKKLHETSETLTCVAP
jgi:hypothetical protein